MKVKIIISLWIRWENSICIDFVHKITFWAILGPTCTYKMLRNFGTVYPGVANFVSKVAQDLKEKSHGTVRCHLFALQIYREKCRGGGLNQPPSLYRVKSTSHCLSCAVTLILLFSFIFHIMYYGFIVFSVIFSVGHYPYFDYLTYHYVIHLLSFEGSTI